VVDCYYYEVGRVGDVLFEKGIISTNECLGQEGIGR